MRITKEQLKQIIKEELTAVINETRVPDYAGESENYLLSLVKKMGYNQAKEYIKNQKAKKKDSEIERFQNLENHFNAIARKQMKDRENFMRFQNATEEEILEKVPRKSDDSGNPGTLESGEYDTEAYRTGNFGFDPWEVYKDPFERFGVDRKAWVKWRGKR